MSTIRVVWGTATGPSAVASYDAALAAAGVHNYNLRTVSSVLPAGSTVERAGTAPGLGPPGNALTVVQARTTALPGEPASAGLGWAVDERGRGIVYEASGTEPADVRQAIETGLAAGRDLRDWSFVDGGTEVVTADPTDAHATAVVLAVYGESEPI